MVNRKSHLSELLSQICDDVFPYTPIINNESINKDILPSIVINSRSKLTTALLENISVGSNLGLTGTGQDVSFMRSTLIQTSILKEKDNQFIIDVDNAEKSIQRVLNEIKTFFFKAIDKEQMFSELYQRLTNAEFGFGMKKGSIPIYIATVLNSLKKDLIFKCNGQEIKINSDSLNGINEKPELYSVLMENWDKEKSEYLNKLSEIFSDYIVEREKSFNSFTYISNAMIRWYMSLPKCAKEMDSSYDADNRAINKTNMNFINSLRRNITNSRDYLIKEIPDIFEKNISTSISEDIQAVKLIFDNAKSTIVTSVLEILNDVFDKHIDESLSSALKNWYDSLQEHTLQNVFPNNENSILTLIRTVTNDETIFAERIGKAITGLRIDDWNKNIYDKFVNGLKEFKSTIDDFNIKPVEVVSDIADNKFKNYKVIITDSAGEEQIKSFNRVEYSNAVAAKLLYRDVSSAIEEIGQSLKSQEKVQILMEIFEKLCD
ncbi:MAG: hypothetical protein J6A58_14640 [Oscillospiraceae bacterium]|nr:hypothetical protein [Oscillospiraceae bacterium]